MARIVQNGIAIVGKPSNNNPVSIDGIFGVTPTSSMMLMVGFAEDNNSQNNAPTNLTEITTGDTSTAGGGLSIGYTLDASSITELTNNVTTDGNYLCVLVEGHDTVNPFGDSADGNLSAPYTVPGVATVNNYDLVLTFACVDGSRKFLASPNNCVLGIEGTSEDITATTAGLSYGLSAVPEAVFADGVMAFDSDGGGYFQVAIKDANPSSPTLPINIAKTPFTTITKVSALDISLNDAFKDSVIDTLVKHSNLVLDMTTCVSGVITATAHGYSTMTYVQCTASTNSEITVGDFYKIRYVSDDTVSITTDADILNPVTIVFTDLTGSATFEHICNFAQASSSSIGIRRSTIGEDVCVIGGTNITSRDFTSDTLVIGTSTVYANEVQSIANRGLIAGMIDSSGNWRTWVIGGSDSVVDIAKEHFVYIDISANTHIKTHASFDGTDVVSIYVGSIVARYTNSPITSLSAFATLQPMVVTGGESTNIIDQNEIAKIIPEAMVVPALANSSCLVPLTIGDGGLTKTYWSDLLGTLEYPVPSDLITSCNVQTSSGAFAHKYNLGINDVIVTRGQVVCEKFEVIGVEPTSFDMVGKSVIASGAVSLPSFLDVPRMSYTQCPQFTDNSASMDGAVIQQSTSLTGAFLYTTATVGSSMIFSDNEYHIEIDTVGTYNFNGHSYINSGTKDVNITASSGTVTINVLNGGDTPTYQTAGAVVVINNSKSLSFTIAPSHTGYEWRLYSVTAQGSLAGAVELDGEEVAIADNQVYSYNYSVDTAVAVQIISLASDYEESVTYYTLKNSDQDVTITLNRDDNN